MTSNMLFIGNHLNSMAWLAFLTEKEVATAAIFLTTTITDIKISPGQTYHLSFDQSDDKGQKAKAIFFIQFNDTYYNWQDW